MLIINVSTDKNTIIYSHSRIDRPLFGSLKDVITEDWYKNVDNHIIKISNENENTLWQVFSVYLIPKTNDYLKISFNSNNDFKEFAGMLLDRSIYNFNTSVNEEDRIIT